MEGCCEQVSESEFCSVTIIVYVLVLDIMRILFGSQWQGRVSAEGLEDALTWPFTWTTGPKATMPRYSAPRPQWSPLELWPFPASPSTPSPVVSALLPHWQWRREYH